MLRFELSMCRTRRWPIIRHGAQHQHRQRSSHTQSRFLKVARARIRNIAAVGCIAPSCPAVRSQLKKVSFKPSNDFEERKSARLIPWLCAQTAATRILAGNVGPLAWSKMVSLR
jgi:hypothetical protein